MSGNVSETVSIGKARGMSFNDLFTGLKKVQPPTTFSMKDANLTLEYGAVELYFSRPKTTVEAAKDIASDEDHMKYLGFSSLLESLIYFEQPIGRAAQSALLAYKAGTGVGPMDVPLIQRGPKLKNPPINQKIMIEIYLGDITEGNSYDQTIKMLDNISKRIVKDNIQDVELEHYSDEDWNSGTTYGIRIKGKILQTVAQVKKASKSREHLRSIARNQITYAVKDRFKDFDKKFVELVKFGATFKELEAYFKELGIQRSSLKYFAASPPNYCPFRY